jgi:hypothetical protein
LFQSVSSTLLDFGRTQWQARPGITAVLHTWGQTLIDHYHLHCIVSGGGVSLEDPTQWVDRKAGYLFSIRSLSSVFRARFLKGLRKLHETGNLGFHGQIQGLARRENFEALLIAAARKDWVVYSKRPFAGPEVVLKYLSRYTHRVGISERRLQAVDPEKQTVTFDYKDYGDGARRKTMTLGYEEFVRRLALHILPPRFVKIRHYGYLANRGRAQRVAGLRALLGSPQRPAPPEESPEGNAPPPMPVCPHCQKPALVLVAIERGKSKNRAPPANLTPTPSACA